MIDVGVISLGISGFVGVVSVLNFLNTLSVRKETESDKLAKTSDIDSKLSAINTRIDDLEEEVSTSRTMIHGLDTETAVLESQMESQLRAVEKVIDKIDEMGK